ncbi:hypothetical protein ADUPG1_000314 [Aduncisulcus paluster]|uniref:Uncharacterized protein n=1 Tax=Aduncisulcus paluster TaxID=2918883 RepID=A0ABQ5K5V3_9EUKA|nr:hypothetical protein ADUPG1_000314 [Aduncisulcus paluster]
MDSFHDDKTKSLISDAVKLLDESAICIPTIASMSNKYFNQKSTKTENPILRECPSVDIGPPLSPNISDILGDKAAQKLQKELLKLRGHIAEIVPTSSKEKYSKSSEISVPPSAKERRDPMYQYFPTSLPDSYWLDQGVKKKNTSRSKKTGKVVRLERKVRSLSTSSSALKTNVKQQKRENERLRSMLSSSTAKWRKRAELAEKEVERLKISLKKSEKLRIEQAKLLHIYCRQRNMIERGDGQFEIKE